MQEFFEKCLKNNKFGFIGEFDPCTFLSLSREKYQKSAT